jgi:acyl carrier protein
VPLVRGNSIGLPEAASAIVDYSSGDHPGKNSSSSVTTTTNAKRRTFMDEEMRTVIERRKAVLGAIKDELVERLQLDFLPEALEDDTFLFGSGLHLDSIDAMEIIVAMQARFGVEIPEGDVAALRTINTLADAVFVHQASTSSNHQSA